MIRHEQKTTSTERDSIEVVKIQLDFENLRSGGSFHTPCFSEW